MRVNFTVRITNTLKETRMKYSILAIAACFSLLACKKDSNDDQATTNEKLTSNEWKYESGGLGDASGNIIVDFAGSGYVPDCSLDNSIRFNNGGTGTVYENADVCQGADATSNFTWSLSSDEKTLTLSDNAVSGIGGNFKIKTLTDSKLTLTKDTTMSGVGDVTAVVNFTH